MIVVGVTGGLGTGKSTVTRMLRALGAHTLDADALAREAVAPGTAGWRAVRRAFGRQVITAAGAIDRRALAALVFTNRKQLARLNRIIHPIVIRRMRQQLKRLQRRDPGGIVAVEVPLLVEAEVEQLVDRVVVVEATRAQQMARVRAATGWSRTEIHRRIAAQLPLAVKRRAADVVIRNTGTRTETRRQVRALWKTLKARPK